MMRRPAQAFAVAVGAGLLTALAMPAAWAADYLPLDAAEMEQTVLRVQMPVSLGSWRQNYYFAEKSASPAVCSSATGTPVTLPKSAVSGGVGYEVSQSVTGSVAVYQYSDSASASAAQKSLAAVECPDDAKVGEDGPDSAVAAQQASDFASSSKDSFVSSITSVQSGVKVTTQTRTTVRGLAVIQTKVTVSGPRSGSRWVARASAANRAWHDRVVAAYDSFGTGTSR